MWSESDSASADICEPLHDILRRFNIYLQKIFLSTIEESTKCVYILRTSSAEPDYDQIVFVIEQVVKILIVW